MEELKNVLEKMGADSIKTAKGYIYFEYKGDSIELCCPYVCIDKVNYV